TEIEIEIKKEKSEGPLNFFHLNTIGLGAIIGAGIFVLSGNAAANFAGPSVIISFLIAAIAAFLAALSYAQMASMVQISGSSYSYVYTTMGEFCAWLVGWDLCLEYICAVATVSISWSAYVAAFFQTIFQIEVEQRILLAPIGWNETSQAFYLTDSYFNLPAMIIVFISSALLLYDLRITAIVNSIIVVFKVVVLLVFVCASIKFINPNNYHPFIPQSEGGQKYGVTGMFHGTTIIFFAFIGFDAITTTAQETTRNKKKLYLPLSIITSLSISTILYVGIVSILIGLVPYKQLSIKNPISVVTRATGMKWLEILVDLGAIFGLMSVILVNLIAQPRIVHRMAKDGLLPEWFSKERQKKQKQKIKTDDVAPVAVIRDAPYTATIFSGIVCTLFSGFLPIELLGDLTSIGILFAYLMVHIGIIILFFTNRFKDKADNNSPNIDKPNSPDGVAYSSDQNTFEFPSKTLFIPIIGVVSCIFLLNASFRWTQIRFGIWTVIGLIIYFCYSMNNSKLWKNKHANLGAPIDLHGAPRS
ncbi:unnamed protein product, partial [Didymodactylos carnosus]